MGIIKSINHLKVHFYSFDSERPVTGLGFIAAYEAIDKGMYTVKSVLSDRSKRRQKLVYPS